MLYLFDLTTSNIMVFITLVLLVAIPVIIGFYVFTKRTGAEADVEAYEQSLREESEKEVEA